MSDLVAAMGAAQQRISEALTALEDRVCKLGAARSTRYAATRSILGQSAKQPLIFTGEAGVLETFGTLTQLVDGSLHIRRDNSNVEWLTPPNSLPWFLEPLRPQGFLARALRSVRPDFPENPDAWSVEQALSLSISYHREPPGAFSVGETAGRILEAAPMDAPERLHHYDQRASDVGKTLPARSSAGGEQPKFTAEYIAEDGEYRHCIVKFSPPHGTPFGERWRALLHLEHLAHDVLNAVGIPTAVTRIVESGTRTYLESDRFDRIGMEGKRHVVALDAIDREFNGLPRINWVRTAEQLRKKNLITDDELNSIANIYAFGQFIGNTDMHFGNLSFFVDDVIKPAIRLAPVYDMLPMMWRPDIHDGGLGATPVREITPVPGYPLAYEGARECASDFWRRAAALPVLDGNLSAACRENHARLRR